MKIRPKSSKILENRHFYEKLSFLEYSTGLEYSGGHKNFFLNYKCVEVVPKKIHVNRMSSFENIDRGYPPRKPWILDGGPP